MGIGTRIGKPWKTAALLAVGMAGGAAAVAVATVPDSGGVIHACVSLTTTTGGTTVPAQFGPAPDVTIIDPSAGQHCIPPDPPAPNQTAISWNVQGPQGQQGPPGKSVTVASGHTLTLAGGQVVTVGGGTGNTYTVTTPPGRPSGRRITLTIGGKTVPLLSYGLLGGGGTQGTTGKVKINDFTINKKVDKASPLLLKACATGKHFPTATISVRKAGKGQQEFLVIKLKDVVISSFETNGQGSDTTPTESLSLNFTKVEYKYSP